MLITRCSACPTIKRGEDDCFTPWLRAARLLRRERTYIFMKWQRGGCQVTRTRVEAKGMHATPLDPLISGYYYITTQPGTRTHERVARGGGVHKFIWPGRPLFHNTKAAVWKRLRAADADPPSWLNKLHFFIALGRQSRPNSTDRWKNRVLFVCHLSPSHAAPAAPFFVCQPASLQI